MDDDLIGGLARSRQLRLQKNRCAHIEFARFDRRRSGCLAGEIHGPLYGLSKRVVLRAGLAYFKGPKVNGSRRIGFYTKCQKSVPKWGSKTAGG